MNHRRIRNAGYLGLLTLALLLFSACDSRAIMVQLQQMTSENQRRAVVENPSNRLLVLGAEGNIYTMRPDGGNRLALTDDAGPARRHLQPTWSPNAEQVAWATVDSTGDATHNKLVTTRFDGSSLDEFEVPFAPFYINWSPDGERLAYLSSWLTNNQPSMVLRLVELAATSEPVSTLAEGQPFYFSWSPSGDRLLTHIGNERVELQSLEGEQKSVELSSAAFPAPLWSGSDDLLFYAVRDEEGQYLVRGNLNDEVAERITDYDDRIAFTLSPDNSKLAYSITAAEVGMASLGPLYVVELEGKRTREISENPVIAFFWSPDGSKLAYLTPVRARNGIRFQWWVWDGQHSHKYASFFPSRTFVQEYLAFFDQYAQSMTIWSPDSSAFAYAGIDDSGRAGIWVQDVDDDQPPTWVSRGVFVAWSPR